jgi:hypothetical protein
MVLSDVWICANDQRAFIQKWEGQFARGRGPRCVWINQGVEGGEGKSAFDEGLAVGGVLGENLVKVGAAERDGGQAGVEVGSGDADNGFGEQAGGPLVA